MLPTAIIQVIVYATQYLVNLIFLFVSQLGNLRIYEDHQYETEEQADQHDIEVSTDDCYQCCSISFSSSRLPSISLAIGLLFTIVLLA